MAAVFAPGRRPDERLTAYLQRVEASTNEGWSHGVGRPEVRGCLVHQP
jgi:hypothetical protein